MINLICFVRKYIIFVFIFLFNSNSFAELLPEDEVRQLETQDNEICLARGINNKTEFGIVYYWDCRKQLIDERIKKARDFKGKNKFYIAELKRIKKVINNVTSRLESEFQTKLDYYEEPKDYKVELRGDDKYYYNLLTFLNYDYPFLSINTKREIENIIETRKALYDVKKEDETRKNLEKFPQCIKYDIKTEEFKKCIDFYLSVEECKIIVIKKMEERDINNKFECKQKSIEKYPDHMALYNSEYQDLKNEKLDEFNIDRDKIAEREKRLAELNNLMSGPRLSKTQLIELRKFEEKKCLMDKELENNLFKLTVGNECENMLKEGIK